MTSLTLIIASTILYLWAGEMFDGEEAKPYSRRSQNWQMFYGIIFLLSAILFLFTLARTLWFGAY